MQGDYHARFQSIHTFYARRRSDALIYLTTGQGMFFDRGRLSRSALGGLLAFVPILMWLLFGELDMSLGPEAQNKFAIDLFNQTFGRSMRAYRLVLSLLEVAN